MPLHFPLEVGARFSNSVFNQPQSLLLDEWALVVEALEDEVCDLLDDAGVGGAQQLADLLELVDGGDLVVLGRDAVHHPRPPVGLHRAPALIHGAPRSEAVENPR